MSVWASGPDVAELACLRGVGFRPVGRVAGCTVLNFAWWNEEEIGVPRRLRAPYPQEFNLDLAALRGIRKAALPGAARSRGADGGPVRGARRRRGGGDRDRRCPLPRRQASPPVRCDGHGGAGCGKPPHFLAVPRRPERAGLHQADDCRMDACRHSSRHRLHLGQLSSETAPRRWDDGNRELERWTEAVALAREQARDQMQADVARSGADGIVLGPWIRTSPSTS
jgi:hypothetical protein